MTSLSKRMTTAFLAAAVVGAGFTGYSVSSAIPAIAEPVRVESQAAAPGFADVVDLVKPAVVSVRVKANIRPVSDEGFGMSPFGDQRDEFFRRFFREFDQNGRQFGQRDRERGPRAERPGRARPVSQGSGFFISDDGYLVTNNHVIEGGSEYSVVMDDGTELDAKLVGADPRTDLAVLKVDDERDFTYVAFADDSKVRVGDWVVAVGNPFGLGGTVTAGIVSARGRDIGAGPYDDFIQIDAAVNRGNSGGPTFNLNGEVVGINTAIFSPSGGNVGIAFAVPASVAKDVVADLLDDGSVERGWLGVRIQPVTDDIAESLGLASAKGAIVADPEAGAPAAEAGVRAGDVITAVNGTEIDGPRELSRTIAGLAPGSKADLTIVRGGDETTVSVTLGELPTEQAAATPDAAPQVEPTTLDDLGLTVVPADDGEGLLVTAVEPGSDGADAGLRPGDVIREVNNEPVNSAADIETQISAVEKAGRKAALLRVENEQATRFLALPLDMG